jgi:hypothetical protein
VLFRFKESKVEFIANIDPNEAPALNIIPSMSQRERFLRKISVQISLLCRIYGLLTLLLSKRALKGQGKETKEERVKCNLPLMLTSGE